MTIKTCKELFDNLQQSDHFFLIDLDKRLPLFYGIDSKGRYCLAYQSNKVSNGLVGTSVLEIASGRVNGVYMTFLSLSDNDYKSVFFALCDDIMFVLNGISDNDSGYLVFVDRIKKWKRMFASKTTLLSQASIQGLYGEMYFLDAVLFQKYGMEKAVKAWGGPQGMTKDFSIDLDWYEIKCISSSKNSVTISSIQQLESENPGQLVVIKTESVPEGFDNGISTINSLFDKMCHELSYLPDSKDLFLDCLTKLGYVPDKSYDKYRFHVMSVDFYVVDETFPRVVIDKESEKAIGKVTYELLLNSLKDHLKER